ncbi:tripartite tricarboxylate transporter substrate binding protein, partial [Acidovorax cavernicola]
MNKQFTRRSLGLTALAATLMACSASAWSSDAAFPNPARQVRIIVPFTAGGS